MDKKTYTYQQMQERIADYCTDMLDDDERVIFENSIPLYPEIATEIDEIKAVFKPELKAGFNDLMERKAVNVSVHVNEALEKNASKPHIFNWVKVLVPAAAAVLLLIFVFNNGDNTRQEAEQFTVNQNINDTWSKEISTEELIIALDESDMTADMGFDGTDFADIDADFIEDSYDEMILGDLFDEIDDLNAIELNEYDIYSILDNLDENDVEQLLKEFENVKIIS